MSSCVLALVLGYEWPQVVVYRSWQTELDCDFSDVYHEVTVSSHAVSSHVLLHKNTRQR